MFNSTKGELKDDLQKIAHKSNLQHIVKIRTKSNKYRQRNIIQFNLPFISLKTNIVKIFYVYQTKHFQRTNKFNELFNLNKIEVRYSCIENFYQIILIITVITRKPVIFVGKQKSLSVGFKKINRRNSETNIISVANCTRVIKYFKNFSFMPAQKTVCCGLSRGIINKETIKINIKIPS